MKRLGISIWIFLLFVGYGTSQEPQLFKDKAPFQNQLDNLLLEGYTDSVHQICTELLKNEEQPKVRGLAHFYTAEAYFLENQNESAHLEFHRALDQFKQIEFKEGIGICLNKIGGITFYQNQLDSAEWYYSKAIEAAEGWGMDEILYDALQKKAIFYSSIQEHGKSMLCLKRALQIATKLDQKTKKISTYKLLFTNYYSIGKTDSAIVYFERMLELRQEEAKPEDLISDLATMGQLYNETGSPNKAQELLIQALREAELLKDTFYLMSLSTEIGKVYATQKFWDKAIYYSQNGMELARDMGVTLVEAQNLKNLGFVLSKQGDIPGAIQKYEAALVLFEQLNHALNVADVQLELGNLLGPKDNYDQARELITKALSYLEGTGAEGRLLHANLVLGELEIRQGNPASAISILEGCLEKSKKMNNDNDRRASFRLLAQAEAAIGNYKTAYSYFQKFSLLNDTILTREAARVTEELALLYETEKKTKEIIEEKAKVDAAKADVRRTEDQRNLLILGLIGALIATSLLFYLNTKNKQLNQQRIAILKKEQETHRLRAVLEGEEKERQRVAKELHDGLGAQLATIKMRINALENEVPFIKEEDSYQIAEVLIDEACRSVREISHNMMPHILEEHGLEHALHELCESVRLTHKIEVDFIPYGLDLDFDNTLQLTVYRIIQELLRNIIKHANAKEVIVQLTAEDNTLNLIVEDDGDGFNLQKIQAKKGIGLDNIFSRVGYLGGTVNIESSEGEGSTFFIDMPIALKD